MSSSAAQTRFCSFPRRFSPADLSFAMAWEVYAPGLGGWTVQVDEDADGTEYLLVDPPLVYGDGFSVRPEGGDVVIRWASGTRHAPDLRSAMLAICPLSPDALAAVEQLAATPEIAI